MRLKERFVVFETKDSKRRCCILRDGFGRRAVCCLQARGKGVWQQRGGQSQSRTLPENTDTDRTPGALTPGT